MEIITRQGQQSINATVGEMAMQIMKVMRSHVGKKNAIDSKKFFKKGDRIISKVLRKASIFWKNNNIKLLSILKLLHVKMIYKLIKDLKKVIVSMN